MKLTKTPGVYITEKNAFPNSVVEVATAVPAFVGYTQIHSKNNKSVLNKAIRITSMAEYHAMFGFRDKAEFTLSVIEDVLNEASFNVGDKSVGTYKNYRLTPPAEEFQLYQNLQMFYVNGGGPCYIVSVGNYSKPIELNALQAGIQILIKEQEPSMLVIPDAVSLPVDECRIVQEQMMLHCGEKMKSRFAILDLHKGFQDKENAIEPFRKLQNKVGGAYSAAYYPWLKSTLLSDLDVTYTHLDRNSRKVLQKLIREQLETSPRSKAKVTHDTKTILASIETVDENTMVQNAKNSEHSYTYLEIDKALRALSSDYIAIVKSIKNHLNIVPPSATMAGLYTMMDNAHGVWKAPANMSVMGVVGPTFEISDEQQENLNVDANGRSINAIRSFIGEGTLVWGARTLDGNSLDWCYINVRRTMIMLEQSVKLAAKAYVFEANNTQTWVAVKSMITNFLTGIWKRGGLAGAVPSDAFSVHLGLGETMTSEDILEGTLRITVLVAISRPAEFIEITFQQQMQKS